MARGAASQAMNIRAMRRGLLRCLAACIVARFGACFAVPPSDGRAELRAWLPMVLGIGVHSEFIQFSIEPWDDWNLRPRWLCRALDSYDSARRSPDAASEKKKIKNNLKRLSELGVKRRNLPQWDQYMVAKLYSEQWVSFSTLRAREARQDAARSGSELKTICQAALGHDIYLKEVGSLIRETASFRDCDVDLQIRRIENADTFTDSDKLRLTRHLENSRCIDGPVEVGRKAIKFKLKSRISVDLVLWRPQDEDFPNLRGGKDAQKNFEHIHAFLNQTRAARDAIIAIKTLFPQLRPKGLLLDAIALRLWENFARTFHDLNQEQDWFMFLIYFVDALQNWERSPFGSDLEQDLRMLPAEKRKEHIQSFEGFQNKTFVDWAVLVFAPLDGRSLHEMDDCEKVLHMVEHVVFPQPGLLQHTPIALRRGERQRQTQLRFFFPSCSSWRCFLKPARLRRCRLGSPFIGPMHPSKWTQEPLELGLVVDVPATYRDMSWRGCKTLPDHFGTATQLIRTIAKLIVVTSACGLLSLLWWLPQLADWN